MILYTLMANPEIQKYSADNNVASLEQQFMRNGAEKLSLSFGVAGPGQAEMVYQGRRFLLTPNDSLFASYTDTLAGNNIEHLSPDSTYSTHEVIVGEIPRDARTLPQIMRSIQPTNELTINDVFFALGKRLNDLSSERGVLPAAHDLYLKGIMLMRSRLQLLMLPPVEFLPVTEHGKEATVENIKSQLMNGYLRFNSGGLLASFTAGLYEIS